MVLSHWDLPPWRNKRVLKVGGVLMFENFNGENVNGQ